MAKPILFITEEWVDSSIQSVSLQLVGLWGALTSEWSTKFHKKNKHIVGRLRFNSMRGWSSAGKKMWMSANVKGWKHWLKTTGYSGCLGFFVKEGWSYAVKMVSEGSIYLLLLLKTYLSGVCNEIVNFGFNDGAQIRSGAIWNEGHISWPPARL